MLRIGTLVLLLLLLMVLVASVGDFQSCTTPCTLYTSSLDWPCLWSLFFKGISYYKNPTGFLVVASPSKIPGWCLSRDWRDNYTKFWRKGVTVGIHQVRNKWRMLLFYSSSYFCLKNERNRISVFVYVGKEKQAEVWVCRDGMENSVDGWWQGGPQAFWTNF